MIFIVSKTTDFVVLDLTCIVNKYIQFGFCLQEGLSHGAHRFQTAQIQLHVHYISAPGHLFGKGKISYVALSSSSKWTAQK